MDKMTQRLWDTEFEKQYPRPEATPCDSEDACSAFIDASWAAWSAYLGRKVDLLRVLDIILADWERLQENTPWNKWRAECLDRFQAIYKAQPLQALEALRSGNLLID